LKGDAALSSGTSEQTVYQNNVRTQSDLDPCCAFG